jgi:hypothetical protein
MRQQIIDQLTTHLAALPYFNDVLVWDNLPAQYSQNAIYVKDCQEKYQRKNNKYLCTLRLEIIAIVIETPDNTAARLGNIALSDLISAVSQLSVGGAIVDLVNSHKWIDTKGVTACEVELNIDVKYYF